MQATNKIIKHMMAFLKENEGKENLVQLWEEEEENFRTLVTSLVETSEKKEKRKAKKEKREKKDPTAPKRPLTAYIFFCNEKRPIFKAKQPDLTSINMSKKLGEEWQKLPVNKKTKYNQQAEADKARYEKEKANYNQTNGIEEKKKETRPGNAYNIFTKEKMAEQRIINTKPSDRRPIISEEWKNLDASAKEKYKKMAKEAREKAGIVTTKKIPTKKKSTDAPKEEEPEEVPKEEEPEVQEEPEEEPEEVKDFVATNGYLVFKEEMKKKNVTKESSIQHEWNALAREVRDLYDSQEEPKKKEKKSKSKDKAKETRKAKKSKKDDMEELEDELDQE